MKLMKLLRGNKISNNLTFNATINEIEAIKHFVGSKYYKVDDKLNDRMEQFHKKIEQFHQDSMFGVSTNKALIEGHIFYFWIEFLMDWWNLEDITKDNIQSHKRGLDIDILVTVLFNQVQLEIFYMIFQQKFKF